MAPEMAAGYVVGVIPSLCVTGLHYWLHKRKTLSPAFRQLQNNLAQVGKLWSDTQSRVMLLSESSEAQEEAAFIKSLKIMGFLLMFLSWVGFILTPSFYFRFTKLQCRAWNRKSLARNYVKNLFLLTQ